MWFVDLETFKNKILLILLGCGLVLSIVLDYMNAKKKLKNANKKINKLQYKLSSSEKKYLI